MALTQEEELEGITIELLEDEVVPEDMVLLLDCEACIAQGLNRDCASCVTPAASC